MKYTLFYRASGEIVRVGDLPEHKLMEIVKHRDDIMVMAGIFLPSEHYINPNTYKVEDRMEMTVLIDIDDEGSVVLNNVPSGSKLVIRELLDSSMGVLGDVVLEMEKAGEYHITITHPYFKPEEIVVNIP